VMKKDQDNNSGPTYRREYTRLSTKNFYVLDWAMFVNAVKWRLMEIGTKIRQGWSDAVADKGFMCPVCLTTYTPLEAMASMVEYTFVCTYCPAELNQPLVEKDSSKRVNELQSTMERWTEQTQPIQTLLRQTDAMDLVILDEASLMLELQEEMRNLDLMSGVGPDGNPEDDLRFAQDAGGMGKTQFRVNIMDESGSDLDSDDADSLMDEDAEATATTRSNLPVWIEQSTVSQGVYGHANKESSIGTTNGLIKRNLDESLLPIDGNKRARTGEPQAARLLTISPPPPAVATPAVAEELEDDFEEVV